MKRILWFLFMVFMTLDACSSNYEAPLIDWQQNYVDNVQEVERMHVSVGAFAKQYGFTPILTRSPEYLSGKKNGEVSFTYWLIHSEQDYPGINIFSTPGYYRVMMFNSGFKDADQLMKYKKLLFESLNIRE